MRTARNMVNSMSVLTLMDGNRREILTEQEIQFLDEDVFYQQESDERARYWWVEQDKEARNKSYQKWHDFLKSKEKENVGL